MQNVCNAAQKTLFQIIFAAPPDVVVSVRGVQQWIRYGLRVLFDTTNFQRRSISECGNAIASNVRQTFEMIKYPGLMHEVPEYVLCIDIDHLRLFALSKTACFYPEDVHITINSPELGIVDCTALHICNVLFKWLHTSIQAVPVILSPTLYHFKW